MRRAGTDAEDRAADYLLSIGYTILTRRWKGRAGELDLVCLDGDVLVFVEVKERRSGAEWALASISPEKVRRLMGAAAAYQAEAGLEEMETRLDAILVSSSQIEHLPGGLSLSDS
ncbi:MAG: YraN family protein [Fimbriimonadaceae bacterium]|nr:YraN family protein [Fimbriimonadaceae bacterium]